MSFDLDVVYYVSPCENVLLSLEDVCLVALLWLDLGLFTSNAFFGIAGGPFLDALLEVCGDFAALEDKRLGCAGGGGVELDGNHVQSGEEDKEANQDAKVSPDVVVCVFVVCEQVGVAIDSVTASYSTFDVADPGVALKGSIRRDNARAGEFLSVEFVGQEDLIMPVSDIATTKK